MEIGVTEMRLLMTGMPYSFSISSPTATSRSARRVILSYIFEAHREMFSAPQSVRVIPMVIVRMSRCSWAIIFIVSSMS